MDLIYKNKQLVMLIASFMISINVFKKLEVDYKIQLLIFIIFSILLVLVIKNQVKNSTDKKRWYIKILIAGFFILISFGIGIFQYYKIN